MTFQNICYVLIVSLICEVPPPYEQKKRNIKSKIIEILMLKKIEIVETREQSLTGLETPAY